MARCRRNVDNFLEACRKIGVDEVNRFPFKKQFFWLFFSLIFDDKFDFYDKIIHLLRKKNNNKAIF